MAQDDDNIVILATTTSTDNSGLLEYILPEIEKDTGFDYRTIAVGTGKALQIGRAGDVDVVMVHARDAELEFVEQGFGVDRTEIMYNDFVVVGPDGDPLSLGSEQSVAAVFRKIYINGALFVSRGDDSGTHKKELDLWKLAGVAPVESWYREVGQGMGKTLQIAGELGAYTLTDRGTWLFSRENSPLKIVYQGDPPLFNQYSIIAVNPDLHESNYKGASSLIQWMSSSKGQEMIDDYRIDGEKLFYGNAILD